MFNIVNGAREVARWEASQFTCKLVLNPECMLRHAVIGFLSGGDRWLSQGSEKLSELLFWDLKFRFPKHKRIIMLQYNSHFSLTILFTQEPWVQGPITPSADAHSQGVRKV